MYSRGPFYYFFLRRAHIYTTKKGKKKSLITKRRESRSRGKTVQKKSLISRQKVKPKLTLKDHQRFNYFQQKGSDAGWTINNLLENVE